MAVHVEVHVVPYPTAPPRRWKFYRHWTPNPKLFVPTPTTRPSSPVNRPTNPHPNALHTPHHNKSSARDSQVRHTCIHQHCPGTIRCPLYFFLQCNRDKGEAFCHELSIAFVAASAAFEVYFSPYRHVLPGPVPYTFSLLKVFRALLIIKIFH